MTTQYLITISVMVVTLILLVVLPKLLADKGPKAKAELTPKLKKRIVQASENIGVDDTAKFYELSVKTVRRLRVAQGVERKSCGTCDHFDLKKGAAAIASNANMVEVCKAITPGLYSHDKTNQQSWSDFGACKAHPGNLYGADDWCGTEVHLAKPGSKGDLWA